MMSSAQEPVTVLLDSFTPIFNSAQTRHGINFLRVLGAKIKNDGGFFILTGTRGSLPDPIESNLESIVDGIIDLKLVRKGKSMIRTLTVRKVAGRQIDFAETEFKITRGKGIMFVEPRFQVGLPAITRTLDSAIRQASWRDAGERNRTQNSPRNLTGNYVRTRSQEHSRGYPRFRGLNSFTFPAISFPNQP